MDGPFFLNLKPLVEHYTYSKYTTGQRSLGDLPAAVADPAEFILVQFPTPYTQDMAVVGATIPMTAAVLDMGGKAVANQTITWSTSDPTKATVTNGVVSFIGTGSVTITAQQGLVMATKIFDVTTSILRDTFAGPGVDPLKFTVDLTGAGTATIVGGKLRLSAPSGSTAKARATVGGNGRVGMFKVQFGTPVPTSGTFIRFFDSSGNGLAISTSGYRTVTGFVEAGSNAAGVAWNASTNPYLAFKSDGASLSWYISPDGVDWTRLASRVNTAFDDTTMIIEFGLQGAGTLDVDEALWLE
jgi:hypothetical protein